MTNDVTASTLGGTLTTGNQPNIISIGPLNSLAVTGEASFAQITATNDITASTLGGTLTTGNQPSITSVGILSGLTVAGNITATSINTSSFSVTTIQASRYLATINSVNGSSSVVTIDLTQGNVISLPLSTNATINFTNLGSNPGSYIIKISYSSSTGYTITWPSNVKWSANTPPTLTCATGKTDIISLIFDGTNFYSTYALNF